MNTCTKKHYKSDLSQCLPSCKESVINPSERLLKIVKLWIMRTYQRKQLAKLDERLLQDIGISYVDAKREIAKSFWR